MIEIVVWLSEHQFPTYDCEPFLAPMRRFADDFGNAHPGYRIVVEGIDHQELPGAVAEAVREGRGPHLAEFYAGADQSARDTFTADGRPYFTAVERAVAGRREILGEPVLLDDLEPAVRAFFSHAGELVSVAPTATTPLLYANMSLLRRAGITAVPRTQKEFSDACAALATLPDGPAHAATWPNHGWLFQQAAAQQGVLLADQDNGHAGRAAAVRLDSPELLEWVRWWRELHRAGHYAPSEHWGVAFELFAGQQVALTVSTSKLARELGEAAEEAGFELAIGPPPFSGAAGRGGTMVSGHSLWLADRLPAEVRDGALAFTQFLLRPAQAAAWHRATGFTPVTRSAHDRLERDGWFEHHPGLRAATDSLRASVPTAAGAGAQLGDFAGIQDAMVRAMDDVLWQSADPAQRFALATEEAMLLLADHNAACLGAHPRTPAKLKVH